MLLEKKHQSLRSYLGELGSVAVAFSGGVDSTLLAKVAYEVLGERAIAVTAVSPTHPQRELQAAEKTAKEMGITYVAVESKEMELEEFVHNPRNRCYYCKREIFRRVWEVARERAIDHVADGSNLDDTGDFRPGMQAARELKVISPLKENELTKDDIRQLSRRLGLPTWNKPALACLATRVPYGQRISGPTLEMVDKAEEYLLSQGFTQLRVRYHGDVARIEVPPTDIPRFFSAELRKEVTARLKEIGFSYVAVDLQGYRTGSMNEKGDM